MVNWEDSRNNISAHCGDKSSKFEWGENFHTSGYYESEICVAYAE